MVAPVYPVMAQTPVSMSQNINLYISCRKLKDLDVISKSDPQCFFYVQGKDKRWQEAGKTECISDNLNPDFQTFFTTEYVFEKHQKVRFEVYDVDVASRDQQGYIETTIGMIMGARNQTFEADLKHDTSKGRRG